MKRILLVMVCLALVAGMVFAQAAPEASAKEDEVYKIVYYHNSSAGGQDPAKDPILKALDEKLGIDLSVEVISTDFESKLNLEVSSGNAPDIMQLKSAQFKTLEEQGVLLPLEDYLPTMKNFMQRYPDILDDPTLRYNGHLYFLNGRDDDSQRIKAYASLWVRSHSPLRTQMETESTTHSDSAEWVEMQRTRIQCMPGTRFSEHSE